MAEFRSIKDVFRDPLIIALVLVGTVGVLWAVGGSLLSIYQDQGTEETRATDQPSTQSLPADDKDQSNYQAPAKAPATGEAKTP